MHSKARPNGDFRARKDTFLFAIINSQTWTFSVNLCGLLQESSGTFEGSEAVSEGYRKCVGDRGVTKQIGYIDFSAFEVDASAETDE